jgi:predicted Holliday junction resolvase-like endonuclease
MNDLVTLALTLAVVVLSVWLIGEKRKRRDVEDSIPHLQDQAVKDFRTRSGRTRVGNAVQHFVPFLEDFGYDPCDARLISGGPIDYVVFDGLSEGALREIVFLDVKTGTSRLNRDQRTVRGCLQQGNVSFATFEIDAVGTAELKR